MSPRNATVRGGIRPSLPEPRADRKVTGGMRAGSGDINARAVFAKLVSFPIDDAERDTLNGRFCCEAANMLGVREFDGWDMFGVVLVAGLPMSRQVEEVKGSPTYATAIKPRKGLSVNLCFIHCCGHMAVRKSSKMAAP